MKRPFLSKFALPLSVAVLSLALAGCNSPSATTTTTEEPQPTAQTTRSAPITANPPETPGTPQTTQTPIRDAIEKALHDGAGRVFPKDVTVRSVDFTDGTVSVDFSKEFNQLNEMGDSVESEAQKTLRDAVAAIPAVEKLSVKVEGKPFESQMTDWATPFSVRDTSDNSIPNGEQIR
jgi:hypothetical protein